MLYRPTALLSPRGQAQKLLMFKELPSVTLKMVPSAVILKFRFSNQVERYLQAHRCSCNDTQCTVQGIDKKDIEQEIHQKLQTATCTHKLLLNVIMQDLRKVAKDTQKSLTCRYSPNCPDTYSLYNYQLCHSLRTLPITCNTIKS